VEAESLAEGELKKRFIKKWNNEIQDIVISGWKRQNTADYRDSFLNLFDEAIKDFPQKGCCCYDCGSEYDTESIDEWIKRWLNLVRKSREERNSDF